MKLSITGTRRGLSDFQFNFINDFIFNNKEVNTVVHGAAHGVDSELHRIAYMGGVGIEIYPANDVPSNLPNLEYAEDIVIHPYGTALERNKLIVCRGDMLIGFPKQDYEELRSGTWAAIRYARKIDKPRLIVYPHGYFGV